MPPWCVAKARMPKSRRTSHICPADIGTSLYGVFCRSTSRHDRSSASTGRSSSRGRRMVPGFIPWKYRCDR
jgi:hypothetical protein